MIVKIIIIFFTIIRKIKKILHREYSWAFACVLMEAFKLFYTTSTYKFPMFAIVFRNRLIFKLPVNHPKSPSASIFFTLAPISLRVPQCSPPLRVSSLPLLGIFLCVWWLRPDIKKWRSISATPLTKNRIYWALMFFLSNHFHLSGIVFSSNLTSWIIHLISKIPNPYFPSQANLLASGGDPALRDHYPRPIPLRISCHNLCGFCLPDRQAGVNHFHFSGIVFFSNLTS
jgi:hypothetical protein